MADPTATPEQVTSDGDDVSVFNGIPDWLYEGRWGKTSQKKRNSKKKNVAVFHHVFLWRHISEDVLGTRVTQYWGPDSQHLCYASFDNTNTESILYPFFGDKSHIYPETVDIKYPKVGVGLKTERQEFFPVEDSSAGANESFICWCCLFQAGSVDGNLATIPIVTLTVIPTSNVTARIAIDPPAKLENEYVLQLKLRIFILFPNQLPCLMSFPAMTERKAQFASGELIHLITQSRQKCCANLFKCSI